MLDKKYRPQDLDHMFGNQVMLRSLKSVLERDMNQIPKCILLSGPPGCGKTTISRIIGGMLGANKNNVKEYNIGYTGGVADAKAMISTLQFAPLGGGCKIIILNECHGASKNFWNCMLEVLEEPPSGVFFILCTTEPEKVPKPIRDNQRGMTFEVQELSRKDITGLVKYVLKQEGVGDISDKVIAEVCKASQGSPRRALVVLDSIIDMDSEEDMLELIKSRSYDETTVIELCRALNARKGWKTISGILKELKGDPESIRYNILTYFAKMILSPDPDHFASAVISEFSDPFTTSKEGGLYNACFVLTNLQDD